MPCDTVVLVTDRDPNDALYQELKSALAEKKQSSLRVIGDAGVPDFIAHTIFSGYLAAVEFDEKILKAQPLRLNTSRCKSNRGLRI